MLGHVRHDWQTRARGPGTYLRLARDSLILCGHEVRDSVAGATSVRSVAPSLPDAVELGGYRDRLTHILRDNIIPFWYPRAIDAVYGGYGLNVDMYGRWKGPADKGIVSQARTLWFFSHLAQSSHGETAHLAAAKHGYTFLREHLWDHDFGGFFWKVNATGDAPVAPHKHLFGQAAGLYAVSEYAQASGDTDAVAFVRDVFALLTTQARDTRYGGYREFFSRDWSPPPTALQNYLGSYVPVNAKTANTHLHTMEAFANYWRITHDERAREALQDLLVINNGTIVPKTTGAILAHYNADWTPLCGGTHDDVMYGYQVKNIWLSIDATETIGLPVAPSLDLYRTLFEYVMRFGFDRRHGGLFEAGPAGWVATRRSKLWWPQAEALQCALTLFRLTGEPRYFEYVRRFVQWIDSAQVDWKNGDWFARIQGSTPSGDKANEWKDPYHHGRAMIHGIEMLSSLECRSAASGHQHADATDSQ